MNIFWDFLFFFFIVFFFFASWSIEVSSTAVCRTQLKRFLYFIEKNSVCLGIKSLLAIETFNFHLWRLGEFYKIQRISCWRGLTLFISVYRWKSYFQSTGRPPHFPSILLLKHRNRSTLHSDFFLKWSNLTTRWRCIVQQHTERWKVIFFPQQNE